MNLTEFITSLIEAGHAVKFRKDNKGNIKIRVSSWNGRFDFVVKDLNIDWSTIKVELL